MSSGNAFRHQDYSERPPATSYQLLRPAPPPPVGGDAFARRMRAVGDRLRAHRVGTVILIHGTFVGTDAFGMIGDLEKMLPRAGRFLRRSHKRLADTLSGDSGNYGSGYARLFETALNGEARRPAIRVERFHWSSENSHGGRCAATVALARRLLAAADDARDGARTLLWGHSHGGNVLALLSNLLAADASTRQRFFAVAAQTEPGWADLRRVLEQDPPRRAPTVDMVTFGTPLRYGWDDGGYGRLLHVVQHRPGAGLPEYRCAFPPGFDDVMDARGGDYIQQLGIAGTDFRPSIFAYRRWRYERRLRQLLEPGLRRRDVLKHLACGQRVAGAGDCALVDYPRCEQGLYRLLAGHAIYTRHEWLLFHAELTAQMFYR